jgi:hypothetical protein
MGVILVFDLDQTIAHHQRGDKIAINNNIVDLFKFIYRSGNRSSAVDRIFLLTNNNNKDYIKFIDHWLRDNVSAIGAFTGDVGDNIMGPENTNNTSKYYETDNYFFDYIMDWDHYIRGGTGTKSLKDIKFMLNEFGENVNSDEDTLLQTFFFDDLPDHLLKGEFQGIGYPNHYIQITPPFEGRVEDKTDYSLVYKAIKGIEEVLDKENSNMSGGKSSCYKKRRTLRRSTYKKRKIFKKK